MVCYQLARIRSLHLDSYFDIFTTRDHSGSSGWIQFHDMISSIKKFPQLQKLFWGVSDPEIGIHATAKMIEGLERFLGGVDDLVRCLKPRLMEFELAPSVAVFQALAKEAENSGIQMEKSKVCPLLNCFWRSFDEDGTEAVGGRKLGYWIVRGHYREICYGL